MSTVRLYDNAGNGPERPAKPLTPAYVQIWIPRSTRPQRLVFCESRLWVFRTHYWQGRTRACVGAGLQCEACAAQRSTRPTSYISAVLGDSRQRVVAQLSAGALGGCPMIAQHDGSLAGRQVMIQRRHGGAQSPVDAAWIALKDLAIPSMPVDTCTILAKTWGYLPSLVVALAIDLSLTYLDPSVLDQHNQAQ